MKRYLFTLTSFFVLTFFIQNLCFAQDYRKSEVKKETLKTDTLSVAEDGTLETATTIRVITKHEPIPDFTYSVKPFASLVQVSFKDWAEGGTNSLAWTTGLDANTTHKMDQFLWQNRLELKFGQSKSEDINIRKTTDILDFETRLRYGKSVFKPEAVATLKTQFAPGYDYDAEGEPQISAFFDPAYLVQSIGMSYQQHKNFEAFFGLAFREIITSNYTQFSDDPETQKVEKIDFKTGIRASANWGLDLMEDVGLESRLQLFSAFNQLDTWDVDSRNMVRIKLNSYLQTKIGLYLLFQKNASERLQLQETFELSFSYSLSNF
jgi:hypothetical protein